MYNLMSFIDLMLLISFFASKKMENVSSNILFYENTF
jgi:hypothetical protein